MLLCSMSGKVILRKNAELRGRGVVLQMTVAINGFILLGLSL